MLTLYVFLLSLADEAADYPESAIPPPLAHGRHRPFFGESNVVEMWGTMKPNRRVLHSAAGPSAVRRPTTVGMSFNLQAPKPPTA